MALWGKSDSIYSTGTVTTITAGGVITGSGTTWNETNGVVPGLVITLGTANGSGVIKTVDSTTQITLVDTVGFTTVSGGSLTYNISEQPVYLPTDSNYSGNEIYGVSEVEVGVAATTPYAVTHSGWVGMTTYTDNHGNLRVKHEVLVAGGITTTTDAADDAKFLP
jgi:hypothetical protein